MKYGLKKTLACLLMAVLLAPIARAADADLSTPKKAGVAYAKAVMAGDMATAKALSTGTEAEYRLVKSFSDLIVSMKHLEEAAVKKFGAEGKLPREMIIDLSKDFEDAQEKINGDNATLILKDKPDDKHPPAFKKVDGKWKMDLSTLSQDPSSADMAQMLAPMTKVMEAVTQNIGNDKYKNISDAMKDIGERMSAAAAPVAPTAPGK